ncbi:ankyrin repeat-containing domain protein, partial [Sphaerosporella brunnea]
MGVDKEAKDSEGLTALHRAAIRGFDSIVRMFIEMGVDKEAKDNEGSTALHWAALNGHDSTVRVLIELGVDKKVVLKLRRGIDYGADRASLRVLRLL